jgi:hypothetical protein
MTDVLIPPDGPSFEVITPKEAVRVLCRHRANEFRLVRHDTQTVPSAVPLFCLEQDFGPGWESTRTFVDQVNFDIRMIDDWALCEPIACMLHNLGLNYMMGCDLSKPVGQRNWWMVQVTGRPPISRKADCQSEAAVMVYAELIRQRLAS